MLLFAVLIDQIEEAVENGLMGILGTAIGTVSSQIVAFVVLLVMASRGDNIAIRWGDMKFDERCTKRRIANEMFRGGTPSLTRQGLASVATMMLNVAAGAFVIFPKG